MPSASDIKAGKAFVELYTKNGPLYAGLKAAQKKVSTWSKDVTAAGKKLMVIGGAITGPIIAASKVFSSMGDSLDKMSARTGIAVESLSELGFAAEQGGADLGTVERAVKAMQNNLSSGAASDSLQRIGLSLQALSGLDPEAKFLKIAEAINKVQDPTKKAAMAMKIFGKAGVGLVPMMAGLADVRQQARDLGLVVSAEDATRAAAFTDQLNILRRVLMQGVFTAGAAVADTLGELAGKIVKITTSATAWIKNNKGLVVSILKIGGIITGVGAALMAVGTIGAGLAGLLGGMATAVTVFGGVLSTVGAVLGFLISPIGLVAAALAGLAVWWVKSGYSAREAADAIGSALASAWQWTTDALARAAQWITGALERIVQAATSAASAIGGVLASVASAIGGWFTSAAAAIGSALTSAWQSATGSLARAAQWITGTFGRIVAVTRSVARAIGGALGFAWDTIAAAFAEEAQWIASILASIVGVARSAAATIVGWFFSAASAIGSAIASAWQWATDALAQAAQWIAGAFSGIVDAAKSTAAAIAGWLAAAWEGITGAVSRGAGAMTSTLAGVRAKFGELLTFAQDVFSSIGDAMAAGDLKLAAEVAWAGIKLAWASGMEWIRTQWAELRFFLTDMWGKAAFGVLDTLNFLWSGMTEGFWAVADSIVDAWKWAEGFLSKWIAKAYAMIYKLDPNEVLANLEQDYARQQAGRDASRADRDRANKEATDARYQANEAARQQWTQDAAGKRDSALAAASKDLEEAREAYLNYRSAAGTAAKAAAARRAREEAEARDKKRKEEIDQALTRATPLAQASGGLGHADFYKSWVKTQDPTLRTQQSILKATQAVAKNTDPKKNTAIKLAVAPGR